MIETYDPELIKQYLGGLASEGMPMVKLMAQVLVILVVGIMLWLISSIFNRKRQNRHQNVFSNSRFQKQWRNK